MDFVIFKSLAEHLINDQYYIELKIKHVHFVSNYHSKNLKPDENISGFIATIMYNIKYKLVKC